MIFSKIAYNKIDGVGDRLPQYLLSKKETVTPSAHGKTVRNLVFLLQPTV